MADVAVFGAGPVGSTAARWAAKKQDTVIYGEPDPRVRCAGIVSIDGLKRIGAYKKEYTLNTVRGARFYSPSGIMVTADGGRPKAAVLDRAGLDRHLFELAVDAGALNEAGWAEPRDVEADRYVIASGADYTIHKNTGLGVPGKFIVGAQYELKMDFDPDYVELYFNVPGFFTWIIPVEDYARVGLCAFNNAKRRLDGFVKELRGKGRIKSEKPVSQAYGPIPFHEPGLKTQAGPYVSVGDAAAQVKATTGGGIVFGCLAARHAHKKNYEDLWKGEIGRELRLHLYLYRILHGMTPRNQDLLFRLSGEKADSLSRCDMDYATRTLSAIAHDPGFMARLVLNAPRFLFNQL